MKFQSSEKHREQTRRTPRFQSGFRDHCHVSTRPLPFIQLGTKCLQGMCVVLQTHQAFIECHVDIEFRERAPVREGLPGSTTQPLCLGDSPEGRRPIWGWWGEMTKQVGQSLLPLCRHLVPTFLQDVGATERSCAQRSCLGLSLWGGALLALSNRVIGFSRY